MVERQGKAIVLVTPDVKVRTLLPIIQEHIPTGEGTTIYTDELASYNRLSSLGYAHETVQHSAKEYVAGNAHTNNIEGIWSNTKRGIDGVHHAISPKYTQGYLDSYIFRYNHRSDEQPMFETILRQVRKVQFAG
jgi:transposase-like protein